MSRNTKRTGGAEVVIVAVVGLLLVAGAAALFFVRATPSSSVTPISATVTTTQAATPATVEPGAPAEAVAAADEKSNTNKKESKMPIVEIETTLGTIRAKIFLDKAPRTAENFLDLVEKKYYDGIIFHRVIPDFMVQTGDPTGTGRGGRRDKGLPAKKLQDEFHPQLRHNKPGILSMANAGPNTGDTQFFITTVPTKWLDDKHAIFGEVISGLDVVKKIESVKRDANDKPLTPVKMVSVRVVPEEAEKKEEKKD